MEEMPQLQIAHVWIKLIRESERERERERETERESELQLPGSHIIPKKRCHRSKPRFT